MGTRIDLILNNHINSRQEPNGLHTSVIQATIREVECWIKKDFTEPQRSNIFREHGHEESLIESYAYLRRHPLLCGLMIFRLSLTMNELGLTHSNMWGATIACAHLYNAVRQELPSFPQWLDMEALIIIHTTQRIFWRDQLPSTTAQYSYSYERATGVSEMLAQRRRGAAKLIRPRRVEDRGIAPIPGVSME
jgi:hypothetical protein